jgi:hypothetical protein
MNKEEKARELYPVKNQHVPTIGGRTAYIDVNEKARNAFLKGVEFANQQPEVEHECKYCGAMTTEPDEYCYRNPNSKEKQPEQESTKPKQIR